MNRKGTTKQPVSPRTTSYGTNEAAKDVFFALDERLTGRTVAAGLLAASVVLVGAGEGFMGAVAAHVRGARNEQALKMVKNGLNSDVRLGEGTSILWFPPSGLPGDSPGEQRNASVFAVVEPGQTYNVKKPVRLMLPYGENGTDVHTLLGFTLEGGKAAGNKILWVDTTDAAAEAKKGGIAGIKILPAKSDESTWYTVAYNDNSGLYDPTSVGTLLPASVAVATEIPATPAGFK